MNKTPLQIALEENKALCAIVRDITMLMEMSGGTVKTKSLEEILSTLPDSIELGGDF